VTSALRAAGLRIPGHELTWRYDTPGGPGGQHANRAATRAEVRFDAAASPSLTDRQRARITDALGPLVVATAADSRSQARNRKLALQRLASMLAEALREERPRQRTRPSRAAKAARVEAKRHRGAIKRLRGRVEPD